VRIVLSASWYPVSVAVHLLRAARRAGHEVRTLGPTSGEDMAWERRVAFAGFSIAPDVLVEDGRVDADAAVDLARWSGLWIDVDGGWFLEHPLPTLRRLLVLTDPHVGDLVPHFMGETPRSFVPAEDVYVMQAEFLRPREKWLPYAFDPEWFHVEAAGREAVPRTHDVTNLGAPYEARVEITELLEKEGLRVLGPGRLCIGPAHRREICSAPIAVVWPLRRDLPGRVFEAAACGRVVATRDVPDLRRFVSDAQCGVYRRVAPKSEESVEEIVDAVLALSREASPLLANIGRDAADAVAGQTWDARLAQLIEGRDRP
jgi:hypothetical protein